MDDLFLVYIPDTRDKLREKPAGILFLQVTMGEDMVEKLASGRVFENNADILVGLNDIVKTNDVRMFEGPKNFDFTFNFGHAGGRVDISPSYQLDSNLFAPLHMQAEFDFTKLAFSQGLEQ